MKWVVRMIMRSFLYALRSYQMYLRAEVSIPEVGSSRMITFEPPVKASATDNLRFCPPDRFFAYSPLFEARFTSAISFSTSC
jgi:hypothetical protein